MAELSREDKIEIFSYLENLWEKEEQMYTDLKWELGMKFKVEEHVIENVWNTFNPANPDSS